MQEKIIVSVYGSLRKGFANHGYLEEEGVKLLGEHTTDPNFTMYSLGAFPGVVVGGQTPIKIEVYEVTPAVKKNLDRLEGYYGEGQRNFYDVTRINTPYGESLMYVLTPEKVRGDRKVESGDWADNFK